MSHIYLDNAATTRVADDVAKVVSGCMQEDFGNASSAHHAGIAAEKRIKQARAAVLDGIGDRDAQHGDIYWTSGGTESDALGVIGAARARKGRGKHIVFSAIEHPAVRESAKQLEADGWRVTSVPVTKHGVVEVDRFVDAIESDTTVAALMLVNNEIGTLMPVAEVSAAAKKKNADVHLHCDAVQALGKVPVDVATLGADSVAFAAHKLHGPKGVGALWLRRSARLAPLWSGGGQQSGLRSGTFNVPGIAGFGEATRIAVRDLAEHQRRWTEFAEILTATAAECGVNWCRNGAGAANAPHVVSLAFEGVPAEPLLHVLESRGVLVSAGSACAERSRKASPVLTALGLGANYGTIRMSFGRDTTVDQVRTAASRLKEAISDLKG